LYLSQTNGPGYCRLVGSLGRSTRPFPTNPWVPSYGGDFGFDGDYPFGQNPVLVSDPIAIPDILGISPLSGQHTAESDLFRFEKPSNGGVWSSDVDWNRYGSFLDVVNKISQLHENLESPRENEVSHRHFAGTVSDIDLPLFDYHTGTQQGIWYSFVPKFDVLDGSPYREFRSDGFNSDGFLTFSFRSQEFDPPGVNQVPSTDYWIHVHNVVEQISLNGYLADIVGYGSWPSDTSQPDNSWLRVTRNVTNLSTKGNNWWHFDLEYEYSIRYSLGSDFWFTNFAVHKDFICRFVPVYGSNNPFDWNSISDSVFTIDDSSTCEVIESTVRFDGHTYSRYPVDEVSPNVSIDVSVPPAAPTYKIRPFAYPVQSLVGERSRFFNFRSFGVGIRDPLLYVARISKQLDLGIRDFRVASFYSSSDALHKATDVLQSNNIENLTQLSGILGLLPDFPNISRVIAKAAQRDPAAILETVDILADAWLAFRFSQAPTAKDVNELTHTAVKEELESIIHRTEQTIYGEFHFNFNQADVESVLKLPGRLSIVTRSKIRIHTDMTTLLTSYLTANSIGMMPTLSRLWAIVPFSFVVDWFAGIGNRLKSIDDQLLWMALGTNWCLHSFKLSYFPTDEELSTFGLKTSSDDPLRLVFYSREFSRLMPRLADSRFDYQSPSHGPNPITVGALVWQFL
jgi:hypothetical protein